MIQRANLAKAVRRIRSPRSRRSLRAEGELDEALRQLGPAVAADFMRAAAAVRDQVPLSRVTEAIRSGNLKRAEELVGVDRLAARLGGQGLPAGETSAVDRLVEAVRSGGSAARSQLPPIQGDLVGSLDLTNPEADKYLRETLPSQIREVSRESQEAVQRALVRGMSEGLPAPAIAREVREVVGLTDAMASWVANFRDQLETGTAGGATPPDERRLSGPEQQQVRSVMATGGAGDTEKIDALVARYAESLINRRAKNIARTEIHRAFSTGQDSLWSQAVGMEILDPKLARRMWLVTDDERLRPTHAEVPRLNPRGVGLTEPFQTAIGPVPGPGQSGDPGFDINCRCTTYLEIEE